MEPLLTLEQVAEVLQVSTKTVLRLIDRGELTGVKVGKAWRFTREDLQLYIDSQRSGGRGGGASPSRIPDQAERRRER